jgi:hypothetical protein
MIGDRGGATPVPQLNNDGPQPSGDVRPQQKATARRAYYVRPRARVRRHLLDRWLPPPMWENGSAISSSRDRRFYYCDTVQITAPRYQLLLLLTVILPQVYRIRFSFLHDSIHPGGGCRSIMRDMLIAAVTVSRSLSLPPWHALC